MRREQRSVIRAHGVGPPGRPAGQPGWSQAHRRIRRPGMVNIRVAGGTLSAMTEQGRQRRDAKGIAAQRFGSKMAPRVCIRRDLAAAVSPTLLPAGAGLRTMRKTRQSSGGFRSVYGRRKPIRGTSRRSRSRYRRSCIIFVATIVDLDFNALRNSNGTGLLLIAGCPDRCGRGLRPDRHRLDQPCAPVGGLARRNGIRVQMDQHDQGFHGRSRDRRRLCRRHSGQNVTAGGGNDDTEEPGLHHVG